MATPSTTPCFRTKSASNLSNSLGGVCAALERGAARTNAGSAFCTLVGLELRCWAYAAVVKSKGSKSASKRKDRPRRSTWSATLLCGLGRSSSHQGDHAARRSVAALSHAAWALRARFESAEKRANPLRFWKARSTSDRCGAADAAGNSGSSERASASKGTRSSWSSAISFAWSSLRFASKKAAASPAPCAASAAQIGDANQAEPSHAAKRARRASETPSRGSAESSSSSTSSSSSSSKLPWVSKPLGSKLPRNSLAEIS
mmetsp:Transcript_9923/g.32751  ORF Transcript_9923/g.32751 Transcript_9923/m.32751 type:complete len:260 (+) Transcript_9923:3012-3791(+)